MANENNTVKIDEVKDSALTNDSGSGATKGKAGLPVGNNNNGEAMNTIDPKDGPSSKAEVISYTASHLAGLDTETAMAFFAKLKAEYASKDATNGGGRGTAKGASNKDSIKTYKEDLELVFASDDSLSEDFKTKAATIFEASIEAAITLETVRVLEALETENEAKLAEAIAAVTTELSEKVEAHLAHVTEKWVAENQKAVEASLRVEAVESFMEGLKDLFAEHYVSIPADKVDVVETLSTQVEELEAKINEEVATALTLRTELAALKAVGVLESKLEGLTDTQKDRVRKLAEAFEVTEGYETKINTLVEAVATGKVTDGTQTLAEDTLADPVDVIEEEVKLDPTMAMYVNSISRTTQR